MELTDGVLHREDVSDANRWCVVVPCELMSNLLKEAHACLPVIFLSAKYMIASVDLFGGMT